MKLKLGIYAEDISLYMNCVFNRNRTLVAMATYICSTDL